MRTTRLPEDIPAVEFLAMLRAGELDGIVELGDRGALRIERDDEGAVTVELLRDAR